MQYLLLVITCLVGANGLRIPRMMPHSMYTSDHMLFGMSKRGRSIAAKAQKAARGLDIPAQARSSRFREGSGTSSPILLQLARNLIDPTIAGGLLSGSLHAITGPDHIAALLPSSVGQSAQSGLRIGAIWGLGHGISAMILGLAAFYLKGQIGGSFSFLEKLSSFAELAVGLSLLLIGGMGARESFELTETNTDGLGDGEVLEGERVTAMKSYRAIFANGILHGCSLDGAPSLAPALVMTTWRSVVSFLIAYCFGTMTAMALAAAAVGEGTTRLGEAIGSSKLPKQLSLGSSLLAIMIGLYWIISFVA